MRRYLRNLAVILLGTFVLLYPTTVFAGTLDDLVDAPADGGYVEGSQEPSDSGSRSAIQIICVILHLLPNRICKRQIR